MTPTSVHLLARLFFDGHSQVLVHDTLHPAAEVGSVVARIVHQIDTPTGRTVYVAVSDQEVVGMSTMLACDLADRTDALPLAAFVDGAREVSAEEIAKLDAMAAA